MLSDIQRLITRELEGLRREIDLFPDDESIWQTVPGITNSAGNLAMHVCGGLQHFLGAVLRDDGYVRNREGEFARRSGSRAEVAAELTKTITVVNEVLSGPAAAWVGKRYPLPLNGLHVRTEIFLLHLATHAAFHLGQAGYLRRFVTQDSRSADPIPIKALADEPNAERTM